MPLSIAVLLLASQESMHATASAVERARRALKEALAYTPAQYKPVPDSMVVAGSEQEALGLQAIREGRVAVLVLAGGQGSRLGSSEPKGCYDLGLPSRRSLFAIQADRIRAASAGIPLYVMTSPATHEATVRHFTEHANFGLNVRFFQQGVLPALTPEGMPILSPDLQVPSPIFA